MINRMERIHRSDEQRRIRYGSKRRIKPMQPISEQYAVQRVRSGGDPHGKGIMRAIIRKFT